MSNVIASQASSNNRHKCVYCRKVRYERFMELASNRDVLHAKYGSYRGRYVWHGSKQYSWKCQPSCRDSDNGGTPS